MDKPSQAEIDFFTSVAMSNTTDEAIVKLRDLNSKLKNKFEIEVDPRNNYITLREPDFFVTFSVVKGMSDPCTTGVQLCFFFYGKPVSSIGKSINQAWKLRTERKNDTKP